ncbi:MAG: TolC family protein [Bacteroidales bacterium]|nr:TolC family protein [Bacteroidales bacterium]
MRMTLKCLCCMGWMCVMLIASAQAQTMTMTEAVACARAGSVQALEARQEFISVYWAWRAYRANRLPSLHLYGNLGNFNRSLTLLQSPDDGSMRYVSSFNMQNGIGLQARQNIPFTGGTLVVYTDLNRIDQFGTDAHVTWYSQPVTISYQQPLFAYNQFKWDKLIEPKAYETGRKKYVETMEQISLQAVTSWFKLLKARQNQAAAYTNYANTLKMRDVASERLKLGTVSRDEYLQLDLRALNDSIALNENAIRVREAQMELNSLLGFDESAEVEPVLDEELPDIMLDYEMVLDKCMANSSFSLSNAINLLEAQSAVEKAKAQRGVTMSLNARFGLSKSGPTLPEAYRNPLDQEVFGLGFSVPIFDWGEGKGRVEKAKAAQQVVMAKVQQDENDYRRKIFTAVAQYNHQRSQCKVSRRAAAVSAERYSLVSDRFRAGNATVLELNTARNESDQARTQYLTDMGNYWIYYYSLRLYALYDFLAGEDIVLDENELAKYEK